MPDAKAQEHIDGLKAAKASELHRAVREEGQHELERSLRSLFWSGIAAGLVITSSLFAEGALYAHTVEGPSRELLIALGYPFGFILVVLGRMQLFTESTITAMLPFVARPSMAAGMKTLRLWGVVLGANLIGTALVAAWIAWGWPGDPALRDGMIAIAGKVQVLGPADTFLNAIPAGFLIAIIAWSLPNARDQAFFVIFLVTYLIGIGGFSHSVVGSVEAFLLMFTGRGDPVTLVFGFMIPVVLGNLAGGAGLFSVLAHGQVVDEMHQRGERPRRRAATRRAKPVEQED